MMKIRLHPLKSLVAGMVIPAGLALTPAAFAQNTHEIAAVVNDDIVTTYDLRQRVLFMVATTGVQRDEESIARVQQQALRNLVDEHIQLQESQKYEVEISDDDASAGVSIETLRDQVRSEIAWQRIINGLFGSRIRISDAQIDETLNRMTANASKPNFRVAEIYIEATPDIGGMDGAMTGANAMIQQIADGAPFPLLAQQFSSSPTAAQGGDVGWVREGELRPEIDNIITEMEIGNVSTPIQVPGGVYVIALLDKKISETDTLYKLKQVNFSNAETPEEIEATKDKLIALRDTLKSCDTLSQDAKAIEDLNYADMGELKSSELNEAILEKLSNTDVGALAEPIERPNGAVSIMVCDRQATGSDIPTRDQIEDRLMDQQLAQASRRHLRDLRRKATVVLR